MAGRRAPRRARVFFVATAMFVGVLVAVFAFPLTAAPARQGSRASSAFRLVPNVVWSVVETQKLRLDVYLPVADRGTARAAILLVHGGAWLGGDKHNLTAQGRALAALGYVAVSVEYRLAPQHRYPAAIDDVQAAVKWLRESAQVSRYHIDPTRIGALGVSAGGNLASLLGTLGDGSLSHGSRVAAVVSWSGIYNFEGDTNSAYLGCAPSKCALVAAAASPQTSVDSSDAPTLLVQSKDDWIVPVSQAEHMATALSNAGVANELLVVPGIGHATQLNDAAWSDTVAFFARYLSHG